MQAAQPQPVDVAAYRQALAQFATGVTVVGVAHDGVRYGMTVNSLTSVSLDPLLVLFCCEHDATMHAPLLASGRWGVSILSADQQELAASFAVRGRPGVDRFAAHDASAGAVTGAPLLDGALAWLECRTWATYDGGDHSIVVGEVLDVAVSTAAPALLYFRRGYHRVDG